MQQDRRSQGMPYVQSGYTNDIAGNILLVFSLEGR
jgi:hypothetical protein